MSLTSLRAPGGCAALPRAALRPGRATCWWLFAGLLALVGSMPPEAMFLLVLVALALRVTELEFTVVLPPARLWAGPVACLALGTLHLGNAPARDVARDVWLLSGSVFLAFYGWILIRRPADLRAMLRAFVFGATAWSLLYLARAAQSLDLLAAGRDGFRQAAGAGSLLPVVALFALLGSCAFDVVPAVRGRFLAWTCGVVCALALAVSMSRTWWGAGAILAAAGLLVRLGFARLLWASVFLGATLGVLGAVGGPSALTVRGLRELTALASMEMLSAENQVTQPDLNRFWRSYEAYRGLQAVQNGTMVQAWVGRGLGARLDLGLYQLLDGEYRRHIPVLHNGFLFVALKAGLAGLLAYGAWILCLVRDGWRASKLGSAEAQLVGALVVGLALVLVETSLAVGGAFNFQACFALFIVLGAAARWTILVRRERSLQSEAC